jgi:hypothetical protein
MRRFSRLNEWPAAAPHTNLHEAVQEISGGPVDPLLRQRDLGYLMKLIRCRLLVVNEHDGHAVGAALGRCLTGGCATRLLALGRFAAKKVRRLREAGEKP